MPRTSAYSTLNRIVLVEFVRLAAQRPPDDLLAEKLCAKGADAENVRNRIRVPAFGEHGDRHDAADLLAESAFLADGVHDLAEKVLVGEVLRLLLVTGALHNLAAEPFDFVPGMLYGTGHPAPRRTPTARCR